MFTGIFLLMLTCPMGQMRKTNNRAARAARTLVEFFDVVCQKTT